jgi:hypothetical protein
MDTAIGGSTPSVGFYLHYHKRLYMKKVNRHPLTDEQVFTAMRVLAQNVDRRFEKHGRGAFASYHEAFGIIHEEVQELGMALHQNDEAEFVAEAIDVAVACIVAVASAIAAQPVTVKTNRHTLKIDHTDLPENDEENEDALTTYVNTVDVESVRREVTAQLNSIINRFAKL